MAKDTKKKTESSSGFRRFGLTELAVNNGTSVFILAFMILLFGVQAYLAMPKEQFPEVDWPQVYINTPYFGNSAADIESLVTRPLEKEIQSVDGIKTIRSTSLQDYSVITVEFESGEDLDEAVRKTKDAVDKAKPELPNDLDQEPTVMDVNLSEIPIVTINMAGDYTPDELRKFSEFLQDELEDIDEVTRVEIKGLQDREVKVNIDLLKMEALQLNFADIANAISSENITMSAGEIVKDNIRRAIRVKGEFESVKELELLIVKSENQRPIYLRDIADVSFGFEDETSIARADGLPVVSLDVIKKAGENLLNAADKIKTTIDENRESLPENLNITLFNDQSLNTRDQVNNLENSIISGVILVVLVLLFFLGLRNAMFVGIAIPLSMLMGILFLSLTGVTMNIVVLFSLILALGLLVDNAIVVVENIYRFMQEGKNPLDAAKDGASEVAMPIIASTATTLAAFLPLAFWPGIMGEFMKYMPITLIIVLVSSLIVALVINPVLTSRLMKIDEQADDQVTRGKRVRNALIWGGAMLLAALLSHVALVLDKGQEFMGLRNFTFIAGILILINFFVFRPGAFAFQNGFLPRLERFYDGFVRWAVRNAGLVFGGTFLLLFVALGLFRTFPPKVTFFPQADPLYVNAFVELPMGADIEATDEVVRDLEAKIFEKVEPYGEIVDAILTQIGENTSDPNGPPEPGASPNKARISVAFVPSNERGGVSTFDVMEDVREAVKGIAGAQISVDKNADGPMTGKPINLELQGEDIDILSEEAEKIIAFFNQKNIPGIEGLQADVKLGKPELEVNIDREAARRYEVSTFAIADAIRTSVFGAEVSKFKQGEDEYPINLRLDKSYRYDINKLLNQRVTFRNPVNGQIVQVPISAVADIKYTSSYSAIKRKDLDRVVTVYSNVEAGYNANEIIAEMTTLMNDYELPRGYSYEFTGEQQQQAEDSAFLAVAFLVAVFSILIILVAQFNSISSPVIIILSVVFSTIGVFLGYVFTGRDFSVIFTGVGIISLAGVVVNNAIVLIDYINLLIKNRRMQRGVSDVRELPREDVFESIVQAGATRLRPVLLTAITTVLGLIPLAIGFNFNFFTLITQSDPQLFIGGDNTAIWGPMAWTVIYGLVFATFLTLVVVPVMYWLAYRLKMLASGKKAPKAEPGL